MQRAPLADVGNRLAANSTVSKPPTLDVNKPPQGNSAFHPHSGPTFLASSYAAQSLGHHQQNAFANGFPKFGNYPTSARNTKPLVVALPNDRLDTHNNPLQEYTREIYEYLGFSEAKYRKSPYLHLHGGVINENIRVILVDWLVEVHGKFRLLPETLFLCVDLIDRFLFRKSCKRNHVQLLGVVAMLISAKYEEIYPPEINRFIHVSAEAYTRDEVLMWERIVLAALDYNITVPTCLNFLKRLLQVMNWNTNREKTLMAQYFAELTLIDYKFIQYAPSMVAAACISAVLRLTGASESWNAQLEGCTRYSAIDIEQCVQDLLRCVTQAHVPSKTMAVYKKYSSEKYDAIAQVVKHCEALGHSTERPDSAQGEKPQDK